MLIYTDIRAAFDKMTEGFEPELTGVSQFLFSCAVELYLCLYCEPFGRFYYELTSEPAFREKVEMIIINVLMKYTQRAVSQDQALLSCLSIMAIKPALVNYARQNPGQIEPDVMLRYYVEQQISVLGLPPQYGSSTIDTLKKYSSEPGGLLHPCDDAAAAVLKPVCPRPQKGAGFFLPGRAGGGPLTARPARGILPPFLSLLAGLSGPSGRKPPADKGNARKAKEQSSAFRAFLCVGERAAPRFAYSWKFGAGFCQADFLPATGNRSWASCLPGKTEARRGRAPGTNRVRARRGERKRQGARLARHSRGFPPGRREQEVGFLSALRKQKPGASTPGKNRGRARLGTDTNPVRDLLTAGVLTAGAGGNCPRSIRSRYGKSSGASCRRRCRCSRR